MLHALTRSSRRLALGEDGPTAVEYAVVLALVVVTCMSIVTKLGRSNSREYRQINHAVRSAVRHH